MNQRISILGCGWLGLPLGIELVEKGYSVYGSTTSSSKSGKLKSNGIIPFVIDLSKNDFDASGFLSSDVLIIAVPHKDIDDFKKLIIKIEQSEIRKVIFISSTSVYPNSNGSVTEEAPVNNTPLVHIEKLFRTSSIFDSTIIRFGGLFGYDRKPGNFIRPGKNTPNPEGYINFIHRDDCIQIILQIIEKNVWNEVLNACADSHPTRREFYLKEAGKLGKTDITFDEESKNEYKIINSQRLKEILNYQFKHADLMNY